MVHLHPVTEVTGLAYGVEGQTASTWSPEVVGRESKSICTIGATWVMLNILGVALK